MSALPSIPFLDLVSPHLQMEEDLVAVFREALHNASFIGGPAVTSFESAFADFCGVRHAIGVSSGTDALRLALLACGVRRGDVVITVPNTFIATTEAISHCGALPEFVDVDEDTSSLSREELHLYLSTHCTRDGSGRLISHRSNRPVTAIVPVHLFGQMANMDPILDLANEYQLIVVEDACQAHGAQYFSARRNQWCKAGSMGLAAAFSFYPGKNLGACGEAGAAVTNDSEIADAIRMIRDHGQSAKYYHDVEGYNGRLDAIQAQFLHAKLPYLDKWNSQRRHIATEYNRLLSQHEAVILPSEPAWSRAVYHLYVIRTTERNRLIEHLREAAIYTGIHYPVPLHLQKAYRWLHYRPDDLPVATSLATQILSLPIFPQLTTGQQIRIAHEIETFLLKHTHLLRPRVVEKRPTAIAA